MQDNSCISFLCCIVDEIILEEICYEQEKFQTAIQ